jgi:glutamine synthetase
MTMTADEFRTQCREAGVHTVEVATPDTQGHLRGKRVPVDRFFNTTITSGANIADAMFVFDIQNDLPDNEYVNPESGYLDCKLIPDVSTGRILSHRPGYAIVFASVQGPHGDPHPLAPRNVLADQVARLNDQGLDPFVATEMEFYLLTPEFEPVQNHIQYSSLTDMIELEPMLHNMRDALAAAGIEVESSNYEYGPGQVEINCGPADAMRTADSTALFKSIVKQIAVQHGCRATFMPKPWTEQSGSGMHVHTSLNANGSNAFASSNGAPNELMSHWLGGLLEHALAMTLIGSPTPNGGRRIRPYTFAPTHIHWGLDNRSVLARCICEGGSPNRVEYRSAGADANPHLIVASILAAGADGVERKLSIPPMSEGDMYGNPGDNVAIPTDLAGALAAFEGSALAGMLGDVFSRSYASIAAAELPLAAENNPDPDEVNNWERERFIEHS